MKRILAVAAVALCLGSQILAQTMVEVRPPTILSSTSASSVLSIMESTHSPSGSGLTLKWSSVAGKLYNVERCTNLLEGFQAIASDVSATEPVNSFTDNSAPEGVPCFYRIRVLQ